MLLKSGDAARLVNTNLSLMPVSKLDNKPDAWTSHQMESSGMTVAGIIENYEDTYGGRIIVDNPVLLKKGSKALSHFRHRKKRFTCWLTY
ncbi:hypothetical protein ACRQ5D_22485 [Mucilaginibacter sp. P25]|uniref:hypothetical protein n=1 Tax=Mucilaginibacter sp. P25 TaxID=3423945 RepID=UPI003D7ADA35